MIFLQVKKLHPNTRLPEKAYEEDAGFDTFCVEDLTFVAGERKLVKLGFSMALPAGWYAQNKTKSGMAKKGFSVVAGVMDSNYRGEYMVYLDYEPWKADPMPMWKGKDPIARFDGSGYGLDHLNYPEFVIRAGSKIAQFVLLPVPPAVIQEVADLPPSERGAGGFGSTGV